MNNKILKIKRVTIIDSTFYQPQCENSERLMELLKKKTMNNKELVFFITIGVKFDIINKGK